MQQQVEAIESQTIVDAAISQLRSTLQIVVDFEAAEEEIEERWYLAMAISQHSKLFLEGKISGGDFLDLAEQSGITGISMDQYETEIEENLEEIGFL